MGDEMGERVGGKVEESGIATTHEETQGAVRMNR